MSFHIDTQTIRRLRDALVERGRLPTTVTAAPVAAQREATAARIAPFVETMFLMMLADGREDPAEKDVIRGAIDLLAQGYLEQSELDELLARCRHNVATGGVEVCLQALGAQLCGDSTDRETAFTLAAVVALADEQVQPSEQELVASVAEWYGVSSRRASAILGDL
ncbi:hypothetical protein FV139_04595 [Parahaliea maris]|uniref:Co-chaperone DjlA N-terminal domain-containing protein n=1 Tax=Parahaliea maris TaxID=2716870 RepID=A0A5C9A2S9_9GAMM|nr:TerB family tellurite resistance protein [Parahaliea maris]TXS95183.1 hypothetical protein FV139_04595 [Parahaliea maris]